MPIWEMLVDAVRESLFIAAHLLGGSVGTAIAVLSIAVRVALLPLTVRFALRARELQRRLRALEPQLARLRKRYANNPRELAIRVARLRERHGIPPLPKGAGTTLAVQLPIGAALYQAISSGVAPGTRWLWVADLTRPDVRIAAVAAAFAAVGAALAPPPPGGGTAGGVALALIGAVITLAVTWRIAAGVGIYWAASNVVGIVQSVIVRLASRAAESPQAGAA